MSDDDDDDDDTVVGSCLHCNAPPPPRSSRGGSSTYSGGVGSGQPCSSLSNSVMAASSSGTTPSAATRVQVSCDDCRSFICDGCHWCHEFQANHEIRVCDRCDAFYCRGCDEMDQCEDCSEVVCNTCSTLMSCKFCGCGLCEDCATACGRCGIVLCARDAKFAVECDTCRMSYCLVCLASGTKDPCVRCGHRPSKRVEQLVHLRLKSIYKAFKQSGATMGPGGGSGGAIKGDGSGRDSSSSMGGKYSSALRSLTDGGVSTSDSSSKDNFSNFDQSMASEVAAVLQSASNSMANSDGGDYDGHSRRSRGKRISSHDQSLSSGGGGGTRNRSSSTRASNAAAERYFRKTQEEMQAAAAAAEAEAEAAAAALLAELDEAEKITSNSKKNKKKKKKKAGEKKKDAEQLNISVESSPTATDNVKLEADMNDDNKISPPTVKKKGSKKTADAKLIKSSPRAAIDDDSSDEEMDFAQLVAGAKGSGGPSKKEKKDENSEEKVAAAPPPEPKPKSLPSVNKDSDSAANNTADFDAELAILLSNDDEEGLETFLANLKGVPGLGAARKTAKKALKKIKETKKSTVTLPEPEKTQTQSHISNTKPASAEVTTKKKPGKKQKSAPSLKERAQAAAAALKAAAAANPQPPTAKTGNEPLLQVVSRTNVGGPTSSSRGGASNSVPASARAECVMHMSPRVVGWVIGKGGSRIRDMMEESGAKIWIDQESMEESEARVVYISGKRASVDAAVRMVKDMVSQAPISATGTPAQQQPSATPAPAPTAASSSNKSNKSTTPVPAPAAQNPSVAKEPPVVKEPPTSFAAAIGASNNNTPSVTPPIPNPPATAPTTEEQPAPKQSWALPPMGECAPPTVASPPPRAAPQSVLQSPAPNHEAGSNNDTDNNPVNAGDAKLFSHSTIMTSVLGCDPRFVALLIGRRGWTVKNIQTESGANLDIDQTVDPPKIIISGKAENVHKAEQMVRDVLKYPHAQLHQEHQNHQPMGISSKPVQQNIATDLQMMPNQHSANASMPSGIRRDISHDSPGAMNNFPPGYAQSQYQHQHHQQSPGNMSLFQDSSSSAAARISEFLPNDQRPPTSASPRGQHQQEWGHQNQARNQFSVALPPFSGTQVSSPRDHQYNMHSNPNSTPHGHNSPESRRPSSFAPMPQEQHLHFSPQNHEPPGRMNDFMGNAGNAGHNMNGNGWDPVNGNNMGVTWNQSQQQAQPGFQAQAPTTRPPLSDNPFQHQNIRDTPAPPQPTATNSNPISDDSLMVDNLFASLGTSNGNGTAGLLSALSLGGPQQDGNWGSKISGWKGDDSGSFLNSRLGDYNRE